jgi:TRAP-type C4-dicarboxylate transport system permease small subunit
VLTFFGAAACYRVNLHMSVTLIPDRLPQALRRIVFLFNEVLIGTIALFMVIWGARLVQATWHQVIPEFPFIAVGITYLPIPAGGGLLLLFVLERLTIGPAPAVTDAGHGAESAE